MQGYVSGHRNFKALSFIKSPRSEHLVIEGWADKIVFHADLEGTVGHTLVLFHSIDLPYNMIFISYTAYLLSLSHPLVFVNRIVCLYIYGSIHIFHQ